MAGRSVKSVEWKVVGDRIQLRYGGEYRCSIEAKDAMSLAGVQKLLIKFSDRSYSYVSKQAIAGLIQVGRELRAQLKAASEKAS